MQKKSKMLKIVKIQKFIDVCHLNTTPAGTTSFGLLGPMAFILIGSLMGYLLPIVMGGEEQMRAVN